jgi:hypothetical protein
MQMHEGKEKKKKQIPASIRRGGIARRLKIKQVRLHLLLPIARTGKLSQDVDQ